MLDVAFRIIVEDYARIEHPFRVENLFDSLHHFKSFIAPFIAHTATYAVHITTRVSTVRRAVTAIEISVERIVRIAITISHTAIIRSVAGIGIAV